MGNCDSLSNRSIKKSSLYSKNNQYKSPYSNSSTSLPFLNFYKPKNTDNNTDISTPHKKHHSVEKSRNLEDKQYILPQELAKREDIAKKYKITQKILGDGATSLVYLAENSLKETFAIKRINKDEVNINKKNIIKEAEICLKLNHKNIIKYYEIYEDIKFINIVMEQGQIDLFEFLIRSPIGYIPELISIDFLIQIFESIDYLHSINIVHCDIKPENFVLKFTKDKVILKLIDFGNARKKPRNNEKLYNFSGTKEYMAPEILENKGFDEKIDEWAAGVIMYNLLTGADPFSTDNNSDYKDNIRFKDIKFEYIKDENLRNLIKKLLERDASKRISSKEALGEIKRIKNEIILNNNKDNNKSLKDYNMNNNKFAINNLY